MTTSNHYRDPTGSNRSSKSGGVRGFTMIELMIVLSIIAILLTVAIPTYSHSIVAARERALRSDLDVLRTAIWKFTLDKQNPGVTDVHSASNGTASDGTSYSSW